MLIHDANPMAPLWPQWRDALALVQPPTVDRWHRRRSDWPWQGVIAVSHHILEIAYYIMREGRRYDELGADYFDKRRAERAARRHVRNLEALGFHVTIEKAA